MTTDPRGGADLDALRARLSRIPRRGAPSEFRTRLRSQFVLDAIPGPASRRRSWSGLSLGAASTAAAAALILWLFNPGPAWRFSAVTGTGMARIDGAPVPLHDHGMLADRLRPGAEIVLPADAQLDLELPGLVLIQITGGTRTVVPGSPGRWLGRAVTTSLGYGELRIATSPRFAGTRMAVVTPEIRAVVTGTTLAVLRDSSASCVCVFEGRVTMTGGGATDTVRAGSRRSVFRQGGAPLVEPIRPMEAMKLDRLRGLAERALAR